MYLIVGLGNPGDKYLRTFHNMGFMAVDIIAKKLGVKMKKRECLAVTGETFIGGEKVVLALPQTFMNLSGDSVKELLGKYKTPIDRLLVIFDDMDIERGKLRLRESGSGGTHNGMRSVIARLGGEGFKRVRVGIGKPPVAEMPVADYVLSEVPTSDREKIFDALKKAADAAVEFAEGKPFDRIMQAYNG